MSNASYSYSTFIFESGAFHCLHYKYSDVAFFRIYSVLNPELLFTTTNPLPLLGGDMEPIILDISAENPIHEIASICMECYEEGATRLMLTKIPYFKEIIISSFKCEHCHNTNNSVQPASSYGEKGVRYILTVKDMADLNRQVIKSETATIMVPEVELEIPRESQKGSSSTIEGFLTKTRDSILEKQDERREVQPELADQLDSFIKRLNTLLQVDTPFTFILEDPTGNSFLENPNAPKPDPLLKTEHYTRSVEDEDLLGITAIRDENKENEEVTAVTQNEHTEVMTFEAMCNACGKEAKCNMKEVSIPFFKNILLMANVCDHCGCKDSEVKSAGGINEKGQRIELTMTDAMMDLSRDILKSETARVEIPALELSMTSGSLGGRFTTIEGLLEQIKDQLESISPFSFGDSSRAEDGSSSNKMLSLVEGLADVIAGNRLVKIIVDDAAGNSYVQNVYAPDEDPYLKIIEYERTEEDDDDLGIKEMKTENYGEEDQAS